MTRLGNYLREYVDLMEWSDEVHDNERAGGARLRVSLLVDGQPCRLQVETSESNQSIHVALCLPFRVRPEKFTQACVLANGINRVSRHGRLEIDPADGALRYVNAASVQFIEPNAAFLRSMTDSAAGFLAYWMWAIAEVAISERDAGEILADEERRQRARSGEVEPLVERVSSGARAATLH